MCVVTYSPLEDGFIFVSSRDEYHLRSTENPQKHTHGKQFFFYAKDLVKGGTWFAFDPDQKKVSCILNAATKTKANPTTISRGTLPIKVLENGRVQDLTHLMPFVLITLDFKTKFSLTSTYWDGKAKKEISHDSNRPFLWASDNLYASKEIESLNQNWAVCSENNAMDVLSFHQKNAQPLNSPVFKKKNADIMTVSRTSLWVNKNKIELCYLDRVTKTNTVVDFRRPS